MKIQKSICTFLFVCAWAIFANGAAYAGTVTITNVYDVGDEVGSAGTLMSTDGWTGDDLADWVVATFSADLYARNNDAGDDTIRRANDAGFSYSIPANALQVSVEVKARVNGNFWQVGLLDGTTNLLGVGGDFGGDDKYFILDQFNRIKEAGTSISGDAYHTLRVEYDMVADTADLILDGSTLLIDDAPMTALTPAELTGADGLFIRTNSQFVGPASITVSVTVPSVPEPSTLVLSVCGIVGLALSQRRRRR